MTAFSALPLIIEPEQLASRLNDPELILVDLSNATHYQQGHIPNARHVDYRHTQRGLPVPGLLPEIEELEQLFGELGHHADAVYVVYDDEGGGWAGRFIWLLDCIGHPHYHYLNGGRQAWIEARQTLSDDIPAMQQNSVELTLHEEPTATLEYLQQRLGAADLAIWDARSADEFSGRKRLTEKAGHIPGAIHLEWTAGMDPQRALRLRENLPATLEALGITPDKEVISYCQTHHRSGFTYLLAKALGYPRVKAYAGSWAEWGNHPHTPVET